MAKINKALPVDKTAPSAEKYPYILEIKYEDPLYYPKLGYAKKNLFSRLDRQRDQWFKLNYMDGVSAVDALAEQVSNVGDEGGTVDGVVDPMSGMKMFAEIRKRQIA